ncbi:hypothetical protein OEZ85_004430 [Tetradesmus obliquus]|uniref:Uncharacterized protein n=1 Tax=Tetradesmus obliquus TaxID=3088 RepID=A0ABY8UKP7_TETOB|nr:hypothetical protein OEZ85_004430 [Tetradesmus obliquus]
MNRSRAAEANKHTLDVCQALIARGGLIKHVVHRGNSCLYVCLPALFELYLQNHGVFIPSFTAYVRSLSSDLAQTDRIHPQRFPPHFQKAAAQQQQQQQQQQSPTQRQQTPKQQQALGPGSHLLNKHTPPKNHAPQQQQQQQQQHKQRKRAAADDCAVQPPPKQQQQQQQGKQKQARVGSGRVFHHSLLSAAEVAEVQALLSAMCVLVGAAGAQQLVAGIDVQLAASSSSKEQQQQQQQQKRRAAGCDCSSLQCMCSPAEDAVEQQQQQQQQAGGMNRDVLLALRSLALAFGQQQQGLRVPTLQNLVQVGGWRY